MQRVFQKVNSVFQFWNFIFVHFHFWLPTFYRISQTIDINLNLLKEIDIYCSGDFVKKLLIFRIYIYMSG